MISDIVCEYLVKRKLSPQQIAKAIGLTLLVFALGGYSH